MTKYFPKVTGHNIDGEPYNLPQDFEAQYSLIIMAFTQYQQNNVNTWLPPLREFEAGLDYFKAYEIPTLGQFNWVQRKRLDYIMSAGISDPIARATTITLYTDLDAMRQALGFTGNSEIRLYLVDRDGKVYWEQTGNFSPEKFTSLRETLAELPVIV